MSATARAIATPELLEAILLQLDLPSLLLRAPLVSRYFHHLIETSIAIQKALFFISEPRLAPRLFPCIININDSSTTTTTTTTNNNNNIQKPRRHHHHHQKITINPFLQKPFSLWFPQDPEPSPPDQAAHNQNLPELEEALPSLHLDPPLPPPPPPSPPPPLATLHPERHTIPTFLALPSLTHPDRRAAIMHPRASWRRMLVQQPAAQKLGWISWGLGFCPEQGMVVPIVMKGVLGPELFSGECTGGHDDHDHGDSGKETEAEEWMHSQGTRWGGGGLRMGQLYDLTQARLECFPRDFGGYAFRIVRAGDVDGDGDGDENLFSSPPPPPPPPTPPSPRWNRADHDTRALMRQMGGDIEILFDERGYYPARVLGRAVGDVVETGEYRHPARQRFDVKLERADWPGSVAAT